MDEPIVMYQVDYYFGTDLLASRTTRFLPRPQDAVQFVEVDDVPYRVDDIIIVIPESDASIFDVTVALVEYE